MKDIRRKVFRIRTLRIASLCAFFLFFNAVWLGFEPLPLTLPALQSLGNPQRTVGDAFAALQYMLYQNTFPWLPLASFFIATVLLARMLCGWVCPFGFVQEILGYTKRKHLTISKRTHEDLVYAKYAILAAVLLVSATISATSVMGTGENYKDALGVFAQAPFNALSPHDTLFAILPSWVYNTITGEAQFQNVLGDIAALTPLFWIRVFVLGLTLVFAIYTPRSWCRYFCPVGAAMALISHFSFLGLKRDVVHCTKESCRSCEEACPMKVPILDLQWKKFTHPECTYCLECVDACATKALKPKFP